MATLALAAAGAAIGGSLGGAAFGTGAALIGRAAGAIAGGLIDQRILGGGGRAVERGRASALRIQGAAEGAPLARVYGRMRVAGQVIWSTRFKESVAESGGGKGTGPSVRDFSYSISFAVALCEGQIDRIGQVWADGRPFRMEGVGWRLHKGGEAQGPDPLIEAVEGAAPAFRGVSYLVFEDLPVGQFGNRVPQINVEVFRAPRPPKSVETAEDPDLSPAAIVRGVAMSPGSGEFVYETEPVQVIEDEGKGRLANVNNVSGRPDALVALDQLVEELPGCGAVSLVASWFGDDLRCGSCTIRPGVEEAVKTTTPHVWRAGGVDRSGARLVGRDAEGRPVFGGTPSDGSVVRYIQAMKARGLRVMFYPFVMMDVPAGNGLPDPWGGAEQPAFPWRGRITSSAAPGQGAVDQTAAAAAEVSAFFGAAAPGDFVPAGDTVLYAGPAEWGLRRMVLHYAHLCALAGGVDAFCIGSELRSLTQIRSSRTEYPAVEELRRLAADVRAVLGPDTKIGYAADWSEYFGHQPSDGSGDQIFHLDPLWADDSVDFVGIDWYPPLTDWRDGFDHLDAAEAGSIHDLTHLKDRLAGGEGFDWFYASDADRAAQVRTPITDLAQGEDWIYRPKDIENWWAKSHHDRIDGVRQGKRTAWRPKSKPIWLTEIGCGAVDKGSNQPNVFPDPKSSENGLPAHSNGGRDDLIQRRVLQAAAARWSDPALNPASPKYPGRMLDLDNVYVWTWDARPWPDFPRRSDVWSDGANHELGHWLNGRVAGASLDRLVAEICGDAGVKAVDVTGLHGIVDGFVQDRVQTPREALQALMIAYGFDAWESGGRLRFAMRGQAPAATIEAEAMLEGGGGGEADFELLRGAEGDAPRDVRVGYVRGDADYQTGAVEVRGDGAEARGVQGAELPVALSRPQAAAIADRWARESAMARDTAVFALPPSARAIEPGDLLRLGPAGGAEYRVDRVEDGEGLRIEATRADAAAHGRAPRPLPPDPLPPLDDGAAPITPGFRLLDLPWSIFGGDEDAAHLAAWADPWPGSAALFGSDRDEAYEAIGLARRPATVGRLLAPLAAREPWRWTRGLSVRVAALSGAFQSADEAAVLNGGNLAALGQGDEWELVQFRDAALVAPGEYLLSGFLRGLGGTEALIGDPTPAGALLILLDRRLLAFAPGPDGRALDRHYRVGPSSRDLSDDSYAHAEWSADGRGLRPHAPVALAAARQASGDVSLGWIRRGRRDADFWLGGETPLFEASERYRVRVSIPGQGVVREAETASPAYLYTAAQQAADGASGAFEFAVAQISESFGPGMEGKVLFNG